MQVFRGFHHPGVASACALTIGNFDGVHRGHQAMLALLTNEARHRAIASTGATAPAPAATLRDNDRHLIVQTLQACEGNVSKAARKLGVSRGLIYRHLKQAKAEPDPG